MQITVVLGTGRENRQSELVANLIRSTLKDRRATFEFVDVKDHVTEPHTIPPWSSAGSENVPTEWQHIAKSTDTFIFVIPEYNHSYPGEWKLLMDSLFKEYKNKHAYVATVSDGAFGGVRVMEHILPVMNNFGLQVGPERLHVAFVDEAFDGQGKLLDQAVANRTSKFIDAVLKAA